jgi:TM2 domain-containing membrane protein YozV
MRPVRFFFFILLSAFAFDLEAQTQFASSELSFAKYLFTKKYYDESIYVLKNLKNGRSISSIQKDSVHYLLGNIYYNQQDLKNSIVSFDSVQDGSHRMKVEAVFFSSFNHAYLKSYSVSQQKLLGYSPADSSEAQLRNLELAGISLLQRNLKRYDSLSSFFSPINYAIDQQEEKMKEHHRRITQQPRKSPFLAATLSAILPGAGKFYAGNKGQGMYTLLISTVLGLQAWEGYRKDGPSSFRFIAYGTLFSSIYIGTIWGSAFAVKFKRDQLNETINDQILFDMHIPLRTLFH